MTLCPTRNSGAAFSRAALPKCRLRRTVHFRFTRSSAAPCAVKFVCQHIIRGCLALLVSGLCILPASGVAAARSAQYVPVTPPAADEAPRRKRGLFGLFGKKSKRACVEVAQIAGAIVTDDRMIELRLRDGGLWRMRFKHACPALSYYQGFYFRRSQSSKLCAGRDAVIARSGGVCLIDSLARDRHAAKP